MLPHTIIGQAVSGDIESVKRLVETNSTYSFAVFQELCAQAVAALNGDEEYGDEHRIALNFVLDTTKLIQQKALSTH